MWLLKVKEVGLQSSSTANWERSTSSNASWTWYDGETPWWREDLQRVKIFTNVLLWSWLSWTSRCRNNSHEVRDAKVRQCDYRVRDPVKTKQNTILRFGSFRGGPSQLGEQTPLSASSLHLAWNSCSPLQCSAYQAGHLNPCYTPFCVLASIWASNTWCWDFSPLARIFRRRLGSVSHGSSIYSESVKLCSASEPLHQHQLSHDEISSGDLQSAQPEIVEKEAWTVENV